MKFLLLLFSAAFFCSELAAQPVARFRADRPGGCAPVAVQFANTSTALNETSTYNWDLGNGNRSTQRDASAVFANPGTYRITLAITTNGTTYRFTDSITVFAQPTADFDPVNRSICLPQSASFHAAASVPGAAISAYHWDFGDGQTAQASAPDINHSYPAGISPLVSLTAVSSQGCSETVIKPAGISTQPEVRPAFGIDQAIICNAPASVQFTNSSTGPGVLDYQWDFGDATASTLRNPSHVYNTEGNFNVTLTVRSSVGCTQTLTRTAYVKVGGLTANFSTRDSLCNNALVNLDNTGTPGQDRSEWSVDGAPSFTTYGMTSYNTAFITAGVHQVTLTSHWGSCFASVTNNVLVKPSPVLNGFLAEPAGACGSPVLVNFRDTTQGAVAWAWNFNNSWPYLAQSTTVAAQYQFTNDQSYPIRLTVTNAEGCQAWISQELPISKPLVGIFLDPLSSAEGCGPLAVHFVPRSTEAINAYQWTFGDGGVSNEPDPVHLYTVPGSYGVTLNYTTINGCMGTVQYDEIRVREKPVAAFSGPQQICGNTPVHFDASATTGYVTNLVWNFGDGTGSAWDVVQHSFQAEDTYTISLVAYNGMCSDTATRVAYSHVSPPFPHIERPSRFTSVNSCEGERGLVTIQHDTRQSQSNTWTFGDGQTQSTMIALVLTHDFASTGTYQVTLASTNGACTVKDSITVYVLKKQHPLLQGADSICADQNSLPITVSGLRASTIPNNTIPPYTYSVLDENDQPFDGSVYPVNPYAIPWHASLTAASRGMRQVQVVSQSAWFGCFDTTNTIRYNISGPSASFTALASQVCYKEEAVLSDQSVSANGSSLTNVSWDFGDGSSSDTAPGATVRHRYAGPGEYTVTIRVRDASGCGASANRTILVTGPRASFNLSTGNSVQLNTTVTFINTTNTYNAPAVTYDWMILGVTGLAGYSPAYQFTVAGTYLVRLIAINTTSGCRDTAVQTLTVADFTPAFNNSSGFIGNYGHCAPVLARFTNTSLNYTRLSWDFGDGITTESLPSVSHIYSVPGTYVAKLTVYGSNGLVSVFRDTVCVYNPVASLSINDLEACMGDALALNTPVHTDVTAYLWDFGDGAVVPGTDSSATHVFNTPGTFNSSLLVSDPNGCQYNIRAPGQIIVHADPELRVTPQVGVVCKEDGVHLVATGGETYQWSPATGLSEADIAAPLAHPLAETRYRVMTTDRYGCQADTAILVKVALPFTLRGEGDIDLCKGEQRPLHVSGTDSISWIGNTTGLDQNGIADPIASPAETSAYTAVGVDEYNCYSDTLSVMVYVHTLPLVNAGPDQRVFFGSPTSLQASGSADVITWAWTPSDYLACTGCAATTSYPYSDISYIVTASTAFGCHASDTVLIKTACSEMNIMIPTAFTPNNDGLNDGFEIGGFGVSRIRSLRIYNRWGEVMMTRKDFLPGDANTIWNGRYKGIDAPAGAYIFFVELECGEGEVFARKGTVMLIR